MVPSELPFVLKDLSKAVIGSQTKDYIKAAKDYFERKLREQREQGEQKNVIIQKEQKKVETSNEFEMKAIKATKKVEDSTLENTFIEDQETVTQKITGIRREQRIDEDKYENPRTLSPSKKMIENSDKQAQIIEISQLQDLKQLSKRSLVIYKQLRLIHSQILSEFKQELQLDLIIKRSGYSQNLLYNPSSLSNLISDSAILNFIKEKSKLFKNAKSLTFHSNKDGIQNFLLTTDNDNELMVRIIDKKQLKKESDQLDALDTLLYETQIKKMNSSDSGVVKVKEEIIEFKNTNNQIANYVVIQEHSVNDLRKLVEIWLDSKKSEDQKEKFSDEKLSFYFFKSMVLVEYLHQKHIYFGDLRPSNFMVFKNQSVKLGNFDLSLRLDCKDKDGQLCFYEARGYSKGYATKDFISKFKGKEKISKNQMFENDQYALIQTFREIIEKLKPLFKSSKEEMICQQMLKTLQEFSLTRTIQKWATSFSLDFKFMNKLSQQLQSENKFEGLIELYQISKFKNIIQSKLKETQLNNFKPSFDSEPQIFEDNAMDYDQGVHISNQQNIYIQTNQFGEEQFKSKEYQQSLSDLIKACQGSKYENFRSLINQIPSKHT